MALAQPAKDFEPQVGQQGKDVIWVPTPQALVDKMLDMARVTPHDYVVDLGSGDGRTVITAAQARRQALGIEYNADMVELSKRNAAKEGVADKATFVKGDIFESDFSKATVVTMFLLPGLNLAAADHPRHEARHARRLQQLRHGRLDGGPDRGARHRRLHLGYCRAYFWMVPAKVGGKWKMAQASSSSSRSTR